MSTSTIRHIVAMPADVVEVGLSYFQGFSLALFPDYLRIFDALIHFPHDVAEPFLAGADFIRSKMMGSSLDVYMVRADLLGAEYIDLDRPLNVIWSSAGSVDEVERQLDDFAVRPLHITVGNRPGVVSLSTLTSDSTKRLALELFSRAAASSTELATLFASVSRQPFATRDEGPLPFTPLRHNCTTPLIELLRLYGYRIEGGVSITPSAEVSQHVDGMLQLAQMIDSLRKEVGANTIIRKNDVILFCPSFYTYLYRADSQHWNELYRKLNKDRRNFLKTMLIRNRGFGNSELRFTNGEAIDPYQDEILGPLLANRQFELRLFTAMIALVASNQFVPALRLPNAVMLHHDRLRNIYGLVNSSRPSRTLELSRKVADYSRTVLEEMGSDFVREAFGLREKILAVCDFPIEWLSIDLLPAMFRYEISRVPSTPGNLTAHVLLSGQRLLFPLSSLVDILIVRSFAATDPIRNSLSDPIDYFSASEGLGNLNLTLVDVASEVELVEALNAFQGMIVIFDCHGNHGGETSHAWLHIGQDRVDVWQLANRARVPPIVILAACSTHALDGSHASVANGLLRSGAVSVIGTFTPVGAFHTGVTVARLLYRISAFVPLVTKSRPCSWREIVSGFLRMSYATDVLRDLHRVVRAISNEQYMKIHFDANTWINSGDPAWFDKLLASVMSATGMDKDTVQNLWERRYQFVETMLLVQLGHPENIMIFNDLEGHAGEKQDMEESVQTTDQ